MAKRMIVSTKCPLCGGDVEQVPDSILKQNPHHNNVELVVTKRGLKQYIHSTCWYGMIERKRSLQRKVVFLRAAFWWLFSFKKKGGNV